MVGLVVIFLSLGVWQIQRLAWKTDLIDRMTQAQQSEPRALWPHEWMDPAYLYTPVELNGEFLHAYERHIAPRTKDGRVGFHVLTPFLYEDGQTIVFVNQGFIDNEKRDQPRQRVEGIVTLTGVLRPLDTKPAFVADHNVQEMTLNWADTEALIKNFSLTPGRVIPVLVYQTQHLATDVEDGIEPHDVAPALRNNHAQYALFWFVMAGLTVVLTLYRFGFIARIKKQ